MAITVSRPSTAVFAPVSDDLADCAAGLAHLDLTGIAREVAASPAHSSDDAQREWLAIHAAASRVAQAPEHSRLAARILARRIAREVESAGITSFSGGVAVAHSLGLIAEETAVFVARYAAALDALADDSRTDLFEYFGLRTVYDRYLLRHPERRTVIETPQRWLLRVACGLAETPEEAAELYDALSRLEYLPSTPTLFNAGTRRPQMSSCYLLDSPADDLEAIYETYADVARLSKYSGGIGVAYHRVRSRGSLIRGTNGNSNGVVPWLRTLDASVAAVNQGGKRKGACCVYLEPWHADVEEFLELRDGTGDPGRRVRDLNLALWVPDLFMRRVQADTDWSLFDPNRVPDLPDRYGADFDRAYEEAETRGLAAKRLPARDLYARMMRTLAETGNGWMTFKDRCNLLCNQTAREGRVVHSSNLCTEIVEVTSAGEVAVCNLASVNLARHVTSEGVDFGRLARTVRTAVRFLDRVIDRNLYPVDEARSSNAQWRPVGLGVMGLQDAFFTLRLPFDSPEARVLSRRIQEEIAYWALATSADLAERLGPHPAFGETRAARGELQHDLWGALPEHGERWDALRARIRRTGLRNSLLVAIAPTATIASIAGCYESIEPQVSNLFKRETLSGEFFQVNRFLVADLRRLGLWDDAARDELKRAEGSVQGLAGLPEDLRRLYRTVWEIPMRSLIDMAAERGPFVDQSQSLNLFVESPTIGRLSSMYLHAWKRGLKTTYYLRSRPATRIAKATVAPAAAVACALDDPETCDACQ